MKQRLVGKAGEVADEAHARMLLESVVAAVPEFFAAVGRGDVEVYNEFSLQHEFGCFLRASIPAPLKVHFERSVELFEPRGADQYEKKEIDIAVFTPDQQHRVAIELKYPRNGQYPEQMFSACRDIVFLEQLVAGGFSGGLFVMAAEDERFRSGRERDGIYSYFRGGTPISGTIRKPTGKHERSVFVRGRYVINWRGVSGRLHYCMVFVSHTCAS